MVLKLFINMTKYRKGVFFVVYAKTKKGKPEYLLLKRQLHWKGWEFPKGGIEKGEDHVRTIMREIEEETQLVPIKIKKFNVKGKFKYDRYLEDRPGIVGQTFALYSVEVKKKKIRVDGIEHSDHRWLDFNNALKKLAWKDQRESLELVNEWLKRMKFREYVTRSGLSVLIGKNEKQNEELVNLFKGEKNVIIHTAARGSPFCVIDYLKPSRKDIKETAVACARYSQDWSNNKSDVIVHIFNGKKVYKEKDMPIGTFGVKRPKKMKVKKKEIRKFEKNA